MEFLAEGLRNPAPDVFANYEYFEKARQTLLESVSNLKEYGISLDPLFLFSLSSDPDCLSQWRAYGSYSIEFDEKTLTSEVSNLVECIYEHNLKIEKASIDGRNAITDVSNEMAKNGGCLGENARNYIFSLSYYAAIFKHSGFSE